ncbi:MAG: Gfo/Idh/MocA family oxidoreductase, partial [Planctomycetota bacterium]
LAAVCDLDAARAEAVRSAHGFTNAYTDAQLMLDTVKPDAVVCVMPIHLILPVNGMLLRRGIPCTIEKPPGSSVAESRQLLQIAQETGTKHMVSLNRRFNPAIARAKAWATARGPIRHFRVSMLRVNRTESDFIFGTAIHCIDTIRHLAGEIASFDHRLPTGAHGSHAWHEILFNFRSGASGSLLVSPTCGHEEETYEFFGDGYHASAILGAHGRCDTRFVAKGLDLREDLALNQPPAWTLNGSLEEAEAFIAALEGRQPFTPTLADAVPSLEFAAELLRRQMTPAQS